MARRRNPGKQSPQAQLARVLRKLWPGIKWNKDDFEMCPACHKISAYSPPAAEALQEAGYDVAHIGACSGLGEWTCGHCRTPWMDVRSPLNSPTWTH
jgi:hypothetical protein